MVTRNPPVWQLEQVEVLNPFPFAMADDRSNLTRKGDLELPLYSSIAPTSSASGSFPAQTVSAPAAHTSSLPSTPSHGSHRLQQQQAERRSALLKEINSTSLSSGFNPMTLRRIFRAFDINHDGSIGHKELQEGLVARA